MVEYPAQLHRLLRAKNKHAAVVIISTELKKEIMKLYHICTKREYEKEGERKINWYKIGILKEADSGKKYIKLFQQPQTEFFVFEKEENTQGAEEIK